MMLRVSQMPTLTRHLRFDGGEGEGSDGRTLVGLAVPFNSVTRIDSWEGLFDEQFAPGAFKRSIGLRTPKLQFDHGTHPLFGSLPVGEIRKLTETKRGLEVEARLFDAPIFEPLREAVASSAIDGMSIRFRVRGMTETPAAERAEGVELRTVTEAELIELGPVVFPAYQDTEVDLRSLGLDLGTEIDRRRLAEALLAVASPADRGVGHQHGPGTAPREAGAPADESGQATSHPGFPPRWDSRARRLRLLELETSNGPGSPAGAAARPH